MSSSWFFSTKFLHYGDGCVQNRSFSLSGCTITCWTTLAQSRHYTCTSMQLLFAPFGFALPFPFLSDQENILTPADEIKVAVAWKSPAVRVMWSVFTSTLFIAWTSHDNLCSETKCHVTLVTPTSAKFECEHLSCLLVLVSMLLLIINFDLGEVHVMRLHFPLFLEHVNSMSELCELILASECETISFVRFPVPSFSLHFKSMLRKENLLLLVALL